MRRHHFLFVLILIVLASHRTSFAQPPDNTAPAPAVTSTANSTEDHPQVIDGTEGSIDGTTLCTPPGPGPHGDLQGVWYRYTPSLKSAGRVDFTVCDYRDSGSYISVYNGYLKIYSFTAEGRNAVSIYTVPGMSYWIQIGAWDWTPSPFTLEWSWTALSKTYALSGTVSVEKVPAPNVVVKLSPSGRNTPVLFTATTDAHGVYRFPKLPTGDYQVRVTVPVAWSCTGFGGIATGVSLPWNLDGSPNAVDNLDFPAPRR